MSLLNPVFDAVLLNELTSLSLPRGFLLPDATYYWRVAYIDSSGRRTGFSKEASFTTGALPWRPARIDLSQHFNRDIVADPGDDDIEPVAPGEALSFTVEGFDGTGTDNPKVRGLPKDRVVGVHQLGDYRAFNVVQLGSARREEVRIPLPRRRYVSLRFLVSGGSLDSRVPLILEYADGTHDTGDLACDGWFDDPAETMLGLSPGSTPVWNGMDCMDVNTRRIQIRSDAALFEVTLPAREERELVNVVLQPAGGQFAQTGTTFNLFAITGMEATAR